MSRTQKTFRRRVFSLDPRSRSKKTKLGCGGGLGMRRPEGTDRDGWYLGSRQSLNVSRDVVEMRRRLTTLAIAGLFIGFLGGFGAPASAADANATDQSIAALRDFTRSVAVGPAPKAVSEDGDGVYGKLRAYVQNLNAGSLPGPSVKLADADNLLDALRQQSGTAPAEKPNASAPVTAKSKGPPVAASYVGSKTCLTCHASQAAEFARTLMGKIGQTQKGKFECENCHGPGSAHVKAGGGRGVGGIMSFGSDDPRSVDERNGVCLACHQKGERNYWAGSVHETRGLACTDCHIVMKNVSRKHNLKTEVEAETCFQCHKLKRAQMQYSSHMPIREGKLTCSNCHNPHGTITESLIREASVNDNCYKCHAEKRGPYLWEHAPVRENCLNCHQPHGSNYEYLLKVARPRLCNECHSTVHSPTAGGGLGLPNTPYMLGRACGNCHSNIHGSNHPNGVYFLR
jgi:DmsE family decaheme c-type cytochrome